MNRWEVWFLHIANALVAATGILYGVMRYLIKPVGEFAVVNHPWQPLMQHLHVLFAPLLVFAVGIIWSSHVRHQLRSGVRQGRRSGWTLILMFAPMSLSGYLIQVAVEEHWRLAWVIVHCITSGLWVIGTLVHLVLPAKGLPEEVDR